jgi:hypothetical protein
MAKGAKFGCGDFLPGFGPDDFQDYDPPVDEIDEPDDPPGGGISVDPIDGNTTNIPPIRPKPPEEELQVMEQALLLRLVQNLPLPLDKNVKSLKQLNNLL